MTSSKVTETASCPECRMSGQEIENWLRQFCDVCKWSMDGPAIKKGVSIFHHTHYKVCPDCGAKVAIHCKLIAPEPLVHIEREVGLPQEGKHVGRLHAITLGVLTYVDQNDQVQRVVVPPDSAVTLALVRYNLRETTNIKG